MNILVLYDSDVRQKLSIKDDLWVFCSKDAIKLEQALHSKTIHKVIDMGETHLSKEACAVLDRHVCGNECWGA